MSYVYLLNMWRYNHVDISGIPLVSKKCHVLYLRSGIQVFVTSLDTKQLFGNMYAAILLRTHF